MTRIVALHPLQRVALVVWVLLLAGVTARVAFSKPGSQSVVPIYQNASDRWLRGEDVYAEQPPLDHYRNPPAFAAAFVPFAVLPEKPAGVSWRLAGAAVFLFALRRWTRHGLPRELTPAEVGAVFLLVSPLALASLNNGQTNLIVAGFLLLGATDAARGRWKASGLWFAAAAGVKVYPLAVALLVGLIGRSPPVATGGNARRFLTSLALGCLAFVLFPFLTQNPEYVLEQYHSMRQAKGTGDRSMLELSRAPRDLFLALRVWVAPPPVEVYSAAKLLAALGMAVLVWRAARREEHRAAVLLALNLGCLWITVLGPATETHTYTLLAPTAAIVLLNSGRARLLPSRVPHINGVTRLGRSLALPFDSRVLALTGYCLLVSPVFRDMFPNGVAWQTLAPQPIGALLLMAVVVWNALRTPAAEPGRIIFARAGALPDMIGVCRTAPPHSADCSAPRPTRETTATS